MVLLLLCFYSITFVTHRELPVLLLRGRPWKESCDPSPTAWATWQPRPRLTYFLYSLSVLSAWLCPCNRRSVPNSRSDCDCSVRVSRRNLFFLCRFYVVLQFLILSASSCVWQFYLSLEYPLSLSPPKFHFVVSRFSVVSDQIRSFH